MGFVFVGIDGYNFRREFLATRREAIENAVAKRPRLQLRKPVPLTLNRLPEEVLDIIYVMTGPYNELALTLRYFYQLFHYEHSHNQQLLCRQNMLLVMLMTRSWYTFDANYALDLSKLAEKYVMYQSFVERLGLRRAKSALTNLGAHIIMFIRNASVLIDSVMAQKFMTLEIYQKVHTQSSQEANMRVDKFISMINGGSAFPNSQGADDYPLLLSLHELVEEGERRYRFIELMFKEIALLVDLTMENVTIEAIADVEEPEELAMTYSADRTLTDERLLVLAEVLPQSSGSLRKYPDEPVAVVEHDTLRYIDLGRTSRALPEPMYWKGLADKRRQELLMPLVLAGCEVDQSRLVVATIERYSKTTHLPPLVDAIRQLFQLKEADPLATIPLIELCHRNPDNDQYTEALVAMLEWVYSFDQDRNEESSLWTVIGRLKDRRLAEILFRFDDRPLLDILGIF